MLLNGVSLACRWWPKIKCWLGSFVIFRGSGPVLQRNPIFLWFFSGSGHDRYTIIRRESLPNLSKYVKFKQDLIRIHSLKCTLKPLLYDVQIFCHSSDASSFSIQSHVGEKSVDFWSVCFRWSQLIWIYTVFKVYTILEKRLIRLNTEYKSVIRIKP